MSDAAKRIALNLSDSTRDHDLDLTAPGISGSFLKIDDLWSKQSLGNNSRLKLTVASHESKLLRLKK